MNDKFGLTSISMLALVAMLAACGSGGGGDTANSSSSATGSPSPGAAPAAPGAVNFSATFPNLGPLRGNANPVTGQSNDSWWWVEQAAAGRATVVNVGRDDGTGLRLHTDPGDNNISGSGTLERNDVALNYTNGVQGEESWWAHSILFPDDFYVPPSSQPTARAVVFDFHDTRNQGGQANFHVLVGPGGLMTFRGNAGPTVVMDAGNQYSYGANIGTLVKNTWYDFVYHVKWSAHSDGFFQAWVNGRLIMDHQGPTLYEGYGVYLKLANYHQAFGQSSSVIHDRVLRGTNWDAVSLTPLEGISQ